MTRSSQQPPSSQPHYSHIPLRPLVYRVLRRLRLSSLLTLASLVSGCFIAPATVKPTATLAATATPQPRPALTADGWEVVAPGLERRIYQPDGGSTLSALIALRIEPANYTFRVEYLPGDPLNVQRWRDGLPGAAAFVNANFFSRDNRALGLLVSDGAVYGRPYRGYGGMFQVQNGQVRVRSTMLEPYAGESLDHATQAFPMLVLNGQAAYQRNDRNVSRRTIVGQDTSGRIILIVTPLTGMSLPALSAYLPTTDMELVNAVNLDGGGSSMLYLAAADNPFLVRSFDPVPAVLAVYPR